MPNTYTPPQAGKGASWFVDTIGNIDFGPSSRGTAKSVAIVSVGTATISISLNYNGVWVALNNGGLAGTTNFTNISMTAGQTLCPSTIGPCDGIRVNFSALGSTANVYFVEAD